MIILLQIILLTPVQENSLKSRNKVVRSQKERATEPEGKVVVSLKLEIEQAKAELALITKSDVLSKQEKSKIVQKIKEKEARINEITTPEAFIFVADSATVSTLESEHSRLRQELQQAYVKYREGAIKDREKLAAHYEKAKEDYLQSKKTLQKTYAESDHLRLYEVQGEQLQAKDFASVLQVGLIAGKTELFIQLLGDQVLNSPLKHNDLEELRNLKAHYSGKSSLSNQERIALTMLIGMKCNIIYWKEC